MPFRSARLLLVDDDPSAIQVMSRMLADYPDQRFATSGEEALRLAHEAAPDLILLDADMPGKTGLDVCDALQADPELALVPIIFVTAYQVPLLEATVLARGASDFVVKPVEASQLVARVAAQLRRRLRPAGPVHASAAGEPAGRVLIVDDDIAALRELRRVLAGFGSFRYATDAARAMEVARTFRPDLMLIGGAGAALDPHALCAALKADSELHATTVVLVAHNTAAAHERRAFDLGAADFIARPYAPMVVQARVRNLLAAARRGAADAGRHRAGSGAGIGTDDPAMLARRAADSASRAKTLMLSYVAHEFDNSLNALLGFLDLMALDTQEPLGAGQRRRLELVVAAARRLAGMNRDLLDLGSLEAGRLPVALRAVDTAAALADAAAAASLLASSARLQVRLSGPAEVPWVRADPARLQQCLLNLLSNAVKYNRPGGWLELKVTPHERRVEIEVCDGGAGLDDAQREHLFEPFNRLGREGMAAGTGLGLAVTRLLVEAMGGQLEVRSAPGVGSCFVIVLPCAEKA